MLRSFGVLLRCFTNVVIYLPVFNIEVFDKNVIGIKDLFKTFETFDLIDASVSFHFSASIIMGKTTVAVGFCLFVLFFS